MGGYNSGGGRGAMRQGHFWKLSISDLKRLGMLQNGYVGNLYWLRRGECVAQIGVGSYGDHLRLHYRIRERGEDWRSIQDLIDLAFTTPNYGGKRAWFVCPSCHKRKGVLWGRTLYRCAK